MLRLGLCNTQVWVRAATETRFSEETETALANGEKGNQSKSKLPFER